MTVLDQRTVILLAGLFYLALPATVWVVLRMPLGPGPVLWCSGGMLGGLGFWLMGLRGEIDDRISYGLGQPLLVLAALLAVQSLRSDLGRAWRWAPVLMPVMVYAVLMWFLAAQAHTYALGILIRVVNLTVVVLLVITAWQVSRLEKTRNAKAIAAAFTLQVVGIILNLATALAGSDDIHTLQGGSLNLIGYLMILLVSLWSSMAYLGLALERSAHRNRALAQEAVRAEQWRTRGEALARAERERILTVLAESLCHSMLQPLTAALIQLELAARLTREERLDPAKLRGRVADAIAEIQRTSATVEQVRALVRPTTFQVSRTDLRDVLEDVGQMLRQRALIQGTSLNLPTLPAPVEVMGDRMQLTQALLQVLHKSLTAVSQCDLRQVTVTVNCTPEEVAIAVSDSGPGFAAPVLQQLTQAKQSDLLSTQGIGLYVVQSILQQHRGRVLLDNLPSSGARVILVLPQPGKTPLL